MRSIAVMNQKGGVGKTTTVVNLGAALAQSGRCVCLIDLDPQAHASLHCGIEPAAGVATIYDVLAGRALLGEARRRVADNLSIVGSSLDLAAAEIELAEIADRELLLRNKLREQAVEDDYLLIDCPPSLGVLTLNALAAVDEVLIPLQPHFLALHGFSRLLETIQVVASRLNHRLKLTGVVFCMFDSGTRLAAEVSQDVEAFLQGCRGQATPWAGAQAMQTRIRRNIRLAEAPSFGQSIFQYAPASPGAEDYRRLADELACGGAAT